MPEGEATKMADRENHDEQLERIMNQLADSLLELSDEEILTEIRESGADPQQEAERTHAVLREASRALEAVNKRLWSLGHTVNPKYWQQGERGYHNNCRHCGLSVNFTMAGHEMWGDALIGPCPESDNCTIGRREASRQ
jgi:hypothetical protein